LDKLQRGSFAVLCDSLGVVIRSKEEELVKLSPITNEFQSPLFQSKLREPASQAAHCIDFAVHSSVDEVLELLNSSQEQAPWSSAPEQQGQANWPVTI